MKELKINLSLPSQVILKQKQDAINFELIENKVIIGCLGYAKSGKDSIAKVFVNDYGYHRVAFADNIKKEMNQYLKELVCEDILNYSKTNSYEIPSELLSIMERLTPEQIDFFTENLEMKKILRPYIIWYGEKLREINGKFCWINRVLGEDAKGHQNIILSDIRRMAELDIFRGSNSFNLNYVMNMVAAGAEAPVVKLNNYSTLLFEVNQFGLVDSDQLTIDTIQAAREQWLIDDTFYIDSRIPDNKKKREKVVINQVNKMARKFSILKPDKTTYKQMSLFNH